MKWLTILVYFLTVLDVQAQCDSLLQTANTDSGQIVVQGSMDGSLDTLSPEVYAPYFRYSYLGDSSGSIWTFTEFLLNRHKLYLSNWCMNRILNWDEENGEPLEEWTPNELRNRSTSRTFPIVGGDTLQFYRTLWWIDRLNPSSTSFNRYVNENGLSYSVELIDADDHSRVMLLDTFIIETTTPSKKPCIYSWFPMVSRVSTIIPVAQVSINAYVKINVWTHGTDPLPFVRQDGIKKMLSNYHLSGSAMRNYNDSVEVNINCSGSASCDISVSSSSGPSGLSIGSSFPGNADAFKICTVSGFSVYSSALPLGSNPYFIALNPGLYIVLGLNQGNVVCTRKVIVQ